MRLAALTLLSFLGSTVGHAHAGNPPKSRLRSPEDPMRNLDDVHPCAMPEADALLTPDLPVYKSSYFENCFSALPVETELMVEHINATRAAFQQYYAFFNIVNDPADSEPSNHQPELGYTLFTKPAEGVVRLNDELLALQQDVLENGASAATFWDIQKIFNKLYDAHVSLPDVSFPYTTYEMYLVPGRNLEESTRVNPTYKASYDDEGEFEFYFIWEEADGSQTLDKAASIAGMDPYDFFLSFTLTQQAYNLARQSVGARMNVLFKIEGNFLAPMAFVGGVRPSDILPETFDVVFESGEEETFYSGIGLAPGTYGNLSQVPAIDTPGSAFEAFAVAIFAVENATNAPEVATTKQPGPTPTLPKSKQSSGSEGYEWDQLNYNQGHLVSAFKIEDEYGILKVENFDIWVDDNNPDEFAIINIWSNFTKAAKAKGVKKAIIDISGNGGGVAISGTMLALSMYPFTPYEVIATEYDQNYNDIMLVFNETVLPLLTALESDVANATDSELQEYLDTLPGTFIAQLNGVTEALQSFCSASSQANCEPLADLAESIDTLGEFTTGPQLRNVLHTLLTMFNEYNPFNIMGQEDTIDKNNPVTSIRGGVFQANTNKFAFLPQTIYWYAVGSAFQNDWEFDEYAIVSDGDGGSTTCIFSSTATQVWANRGISRAKIPLTTVTYGGTKDPSDTTVAGFPASVQTVKAGYPIISAGLLHMTQFVLPDNLTSTVDLIVDYYGSTVPVPPYFAEGLPMMPVINFYSYFMEPGALPLQYVKITGDQHIPQIYSKVSIEDGADLTALYKETAMRAFTGVLPEESFDEPLLSSKDP